MSSTQAGHYNDKITVLLVEDEKDQAEMTKIALWGCDPSLDVTSVETPAEALKLIEKKAFDCIISDYAMSGLNGVQLCTQIRKSSTVPFIIYTGRGSEDVATDAFSVGVDDYVRKERELAHYKILARRIKHIVEKRHVEESLRISEQLLRQSNELLEAVTKGTNVIIAAQDKNLHYTYFNELYRNEVERLTGKTIQIGSSMADAFEHLPKQQKLAVDEWTRALQGESVDKTIEFGDPAGYHRFYRSLKTPIRNDRGEIIGAGEIAYNITKPKKRMKQ